MPGPEQIGSYYQSENYISHSNINRGFINKLYHQVRKRTLLQKGNLVENKTGRKQGNILDIGCGTGAFLNTMKKANWKVTGLEPDETARKKALDLYDLQLNTSEKLFSLPNESFDAITMWHVLEHVHDLHEYTNQVKSLLKPNGRLFVAVPNYTCFDEEIYKESWAAYDVPRHLYHFSPASMKELFYLHGFQVISMKPMWFDSFYVSMLSEKYKTGKPNFLRATLNGLESNSKAMVDVKKCSSVIYIAQPGRLT
ncbi:MAG: class I SAM-dependent methyltransferase [Ginsengibacter sp.]